MATLTTAASSKQLPSVLGSSISLNIGHLAVASTLLLPTFLRHIYTDYQTFLSLGPGGTPKTISGYLRVRILSLFALRDPTSPPKVPYYLVTRHGTLKSTNLPQRQGPRPETKGIAPHRQTTQQSPAAVFRSLSQRIQDLALGNPDWELGTSCFEKHGTGLFSTFPQRRTCGGEICHAHPSDGSLHLTLHPADAGVLLQRGWGERHPLAKGGWFERFVPGGFVMVYAPRDEAEIEILLEVILAAAWWVGGQEVAGVKEVRRDSGIDVQIKVDECGPAT